MIQKIFRPRSKATLFRYVRGDTYFLDHKKAAYVAPRFLKKTLIWSHDRGLNPRPHPYHGCALPTELSRHKSLLILTYLPRSRQATSGGGSSCWLSIRVSAGSALRTLLVAPRRCRLPSKLLRIRQQSSRPSGFAVYLGASVIRLEPAQ